MSWVPIKKYCEIHPWPTASTLRWMIWKFEKKMKIVLPFIQRYGRRVLIEDQKFQNWVGSEEFRVSMKEHWIEVTEQDKGKNATGAVFGNARKKDTEYRKADDMDEKGS